MKGPIYVSVPPHSERGMCRSCESAIYWVVTAKGKRMPVDCSIAGGIEPTRKEPGRGVSHFATCPHANQHRKKTRGAP